MFKQLLKDFRELRANTQRGFRCNTWRKYLGFRFTPYERVTGTNPPVCCGFQIDLGWMTVYYGV